MWRLALLLAVAGAGVPKAAANHNSFEPTPTASLPPAWLSDPVPELSGWYYLPDYPGWVVGTEESCYCAGWTASWGTSNEKLAATVSKWIVFSVTILNLIFYGWHSFKATCGWEEVYVSCIELVHVCFGIWHNADSPATLYLSTGNRASWLRYAEWLLTCPVILIHLSNLTGMSDDYSKRTMILIVSDIGTIVFGATAALSLSFVKIIFFFLGFSYGCTTFFFAAKVYIEAYHTVPKGTCRMIVRGLAYVYFLSWSMFPLLFVLGPEGFNHISGYSSVLAHEICDIFSKNLWTLMGHFLRVKIHEHILIHGNLTKKTKIIVAGEEMEVETYVDDENEEGVENNGTADLANRHSFVVMRDRLKAKGVEVRASLDDTKKEGMEMGDVMGQGMGMGGMGGMGMGAMGGMGGMAGAASGSLQPGRVILVVPDLQLVDFFRTQFAALPARFELVPALGSDVAMQLAQQALMLGGASYVDFVLVHPEFLKDTSGVGLVQRLRGCGMRVAAFGWQPQGPARDLIESACSMIDGYVEGPGPMGFNPQSLLQLAMRMQAMKRSPAMGTLGMSSMGAGAMSGGGMGSMPHMQSAMGASMNGGMGMAGSGMSMSGAGMNGLGGAPALNAMGTLGRTSINSQVSLGPGMNGMNGANTNPLYGSPSPLTSAPNHPAPAGGMGGAQVQSSEAEVMSNLMAEINRLKAELGEPQQG